ncbi:MAG: hypothetical protein IH602_13780 [Bryobacteraceae bacterium]|jgi:hypothetical protein|nr:hypothetical protein [Bryobacteraceae bacterium]
MIRTILYLSAALLPLFAQAPAPGSVEEAVASRAAEFYKLQMEGKFRAAEKLVCESSQEAYYLSEKKKWLSAEVADVKMAEGGQKATVAIVLGSTVMTPMGNLQVKSRLPSEWRLEAGAWCNHMPESEPGPKETPFGKFSAGPGLPGTSAGPPDMKMVDKSFVMNAVRVSRKSLRVKGYAASGDQTEVENALQGPVDLKLVSPRVQGLQVTLSKTTLNATEKAVLKVDYKPENDTLKPSQAIIIQVTPTGQRIEIPLHFDVQKEVLDQMPEGLRPKQQ